MHKRRAVLVLGMASVAALAYYIAKGELMSYLSIAKEAGAKYDIDPLLIMALAKAESNLRVSAVNVNSNKTTDYGLMQINSINLEFVGATKDTIFDPTINIHGGAKLLRQKSDYIAGKKGIAPSTRELISAYNEGEGRLVKSGIVNLAYVTRVWFWYGIYKLRGGI